MEALDWAGIIGAGTVLLGTLGVGCKWLVTFIVGQANAVNDVLKTENTALKDRIAILEVKAEARERMER